MSNSSEDDSMSEDSASDLEGDEAEVLSQNDGDDDGGGHDADQDFRSSPAPSHEQEGGETNPLSLPSMRFGARDHAYLNSVSGATYALSTTGSASDSRTSPTLTVPILLLPGVVLFPGMTLPMRLKNRLWIKHVGDQVDQLLQNNPRSPNGSTTAQLAIMSYDSLSMEESRYVHYRHMRRIGTNRNEPRVVGWGSRQVRQSVPGRTQVSLHDNFSDIRNETEPSRTTTQHPLVGRVGTIATILRVHESSNSYSMDRALPSLAESQIRGRFRDSRELIATATGTSRFRVLSLASNATQPESGLKMFEVEVIHDNPIYPPPRHRGRGVASKDGDTSTSPYLNRQDRLVWDLSCRTPIPYFAYKQIWPWDLIGKIIKILDKTTEKDTDNNTVSSTLQRRGLPSSISIPPSAMEPTAFSFWMADNIPLSEQTRLELLDSPTTLERLQILHEKLQDFLRQQTMVYCQLCRAPLADIKDTFTVGGAQALTSNYVNEHGFVHQLTTFRELDDERVNFVGESCTANSYFPGYSWTIAQCAYCNSHLGWKFLPIDSHHIVSAEHPSVFYGLVASSLALSHDP